jgi:phosphoglycolate phosphatase
MNHAIIFDMDGTLFETEPVALKAYYKTFDKLRSEGLYNGPTPTDEMLLNQLGKTLQEIWETLLPGCDKEVHKKADEWMFIFEKELIESGEGNLYPGVKEVFTILKKRGYSLFVASNGREDYIQAIVDYFQLNDLFVDLYSAGRFQTKSKIDLVRRLINTFNIKEGTMVGDRHSDVEAGKTNGLKVIGCMYGFANDKELQGADRIITSFYELNDWFK